MIPKRSAFVLVATCVASIVDAQGPTDPCIDYAPTNSIVWPTAGYGDGAGFQRVVAGNFDGSEDLDGIDVVVLAGQAVVLALRINYQSAIFALSLEFATEETISDIAVLPDAFAGKDGLLVSNADG